MPAAVVAIFGVVGAAYGAYTSQKAGKAQKQTNEYNAQVADEQALLEKQTAAENKILIERAKKVNVTATQEQAMRDTEQLQKKYASLEGTQRASFAASGIGGGSVTSADIVKDTEMARAEDEQMIRYNADMNAWKITQGADVAAWDTDRQAGLRVSGLKSQAEGYRRAGKYAYQAGKLNSYTSILEGASTLAKYYS